MNAVAAGTYAGCNLDAQASVVGYVEGDTSGTTSCSNAAFTKILNYDRLIDVLAFPGPLNIQPEWQVVGPSGLPISSWADFASGNSNLRLDLVEFQSSKTFWTGSAGNGYVNDNCADFSSIAGTGVVGTTGNNLGGMLDFFTASCSTGHYVLCACFDSTNPTTFTPTTMEPTLSPTHAPTLAPLPNPSTSPSSSPSISPSSSPSQSPSVSPSLNPSSSPSQAPSLNPSLSPSLNPSTSPSQSPSSSPEVGSTNSPTSSPLDPTSSPSKSPTHSPTSSPSQSPSLNPSNSPYPLLHLNLLLSTLLNHLPPTLPLPLSPPSHLHPILRFPPTITSLLMCAMV